METLEMMRFCIATDETVYFVRIKDFILRHSNGEFYDYYVYYPFREKVEVISVPQAYENPDLDADKRFFEINEGFLLHKKFVESYTTKDHKVQTLLDEMTDILPEMIIGRGRVRKFREAILW